MYYKNDGSMLDRLTRKEKQLEIQLAAQRRSVEITERELCQVRFAKSGLTEAVPAVAEHRQNVIGA
jgi:hypothetical protein